MKIIGKKGVSGVSEYMILFMMILAFGMLVSMPWWLKGYLHHRTSTAPFYTEYMILLWISGLIAEAMMFCGYKLMRNINKKKPFIMQNAVLIRSIAFCCMAVTVTYIVAIAFLPSFFVVLIALVFTVLSIICLVFAELFKQAVKFKEENELTI